MPITRIYRSPPALCFFDSIRLYLPQDPAASDLGRRIRFRCREALSILSHDPHLLLADFSDRTKDGDSCFSWNSDRHLDISGQNLFEGSVQRGRETAVDG